MKVCSSESIAAEPVMMEGAEGVKMRVLIGDPDGAPNFVMRKFDVAPGGCTPRHHHPYEHEVFILSGNGILMDGDKERPFKAGDCVYVASDELHQFRNTGDQTLQFICLIPQIKKSCM